MTNPDCPDWRGFGKPGKCDRCSSPLPPRRSRWCSDECREIFYRHHVWTYAKKDALRRAGNKCEHCGVISLELDRRAVRSRFSARRESAEYLNRLEVNHKIPRQGRSLGANSCLNHHDNLEVLCHDCHVAVTKEQRAAGLLKRAEPIKEPTA